MPVKIFNAGKNQKTASFILPADIADKRHSIHFRHTKIGKYDIGALRPVKLQGLCAVFSIFSQCDSQGIPFDNITDADSHQHFIFNDHGFIHGSASLIWCVTDGSGLFVCGSKCEVFNSDYCRKYTCNQ